jgi:drug/metabolite transporter (DMT)-like permease
MSTETKSHFSLSWFSNQPYLLLSLASLFWAGNVILARFVAGAVPPMTLVFFRWIGVFLVLLPFAKDHLRRDWPVLRKNLPLLLLMAATGFAFANAACYWAMWYTEALNVFVINSASPLGVGLWSLALFGILLTRAQGVGIIISLLGVLTIIVRGDFSSLLSITPNRGDLIFASAVITFDLYAALMMRAPVTHHLSLLTFTTGCATVMMLPFAAWEYLAGFTLKLDALSAGTLVYVVIFPSMLAYICYNRAIALIGANRAAPFAHLVPLFGSIMAILLLGEKLQPFHLIGYPLVIAGVVIASRQGAAVRKPMEVEAGAS